MCVQLKAARQTNTQSPISLYGILFQRAWLQGILVSTLTSGGLDDGTGIISLCLSADFLNREFEIGMYVMVVGGYYVGNDNTLPLIKVHKIVDLSPYPDREAMWYLEVPEAYKLFYQPFA